MDYFAQQLINGIVLGSIYGLIAIGYTMVYGIVGMINFAHGDIFMIGGFIALISFLVLVSLGLSAVPVILLIVLLVSMAITALYGWTVERIAYRPLRHSFRLAPMLSAIGNDLGFEHAFLRQIVAHGRAGDAVIAVSTSGNSANLLGALAKARSMGMVTIAFAGGDGGRMRSQGVADHCLVVPSGSIHRIQEGHVLLLHLLWDAVHLALGEEDAI